MNFNEFVLLLHFFISHAQIDTETMNIMLHHICSRILLIGSSWGPKAVGGAAHLACFFTNPSSGLLIFDKALSLPVSDLQEVDLMTVPESEGAVTVPVHGTTMIPLDLGLYKQLLAEYTGCCIDEVRFFDWC